MLSTKLPITALLLVAIFSSAAAVQAQTPAKSVVAAPAVNSSGPKIDVLQMRSQFANRVPNFIQTNQPPAGFPVEVYSYNALSANFTQTLTGKYPAMSGTIMTKDAPRQPYDWYRNFLTQHGWTITPPASKLSPMEQQGKLMMIIATKDKLSVTIACLKTDKDPFTIVNISSMPSGK